MCRTIPGSDWTPVSASVMTKRITEQAGKLKAIVTGLNDLNKLISSETESTLTLKENEKAVSSSLQAFADEIIDTGCGQETVLTSRDIKDIAMKHGLLKEIVQTESCGQACECESKSSFPTQCLTKMYLHESNEKH